MQTVLIISPHFPPVNAADMHRVRQSLPYFKDMGWKPVVFVVEPEFIEGAKDELLLDSIPSEVEVHKVKAWSSKLTRKVGLGNLGIRCYFHLKRAVDRYLKNNKVDIIYFSNTVFVSMALGPHWKRKFGIPFVIDLQDPWRNDFHLGEPQVKRSKKFWFDYYLNHFLEARTMPKCAGIIAVSASYITTIKQRYPKCRDLAGLTLPFGALAQDFIIANTLPSSRIGKDSVDLVYIGRGGSDMSLAVSALFLAYKKGLVQAPELFSKARFTFIGTSYAPDGQGMKTIEPLAVEFGVEDFVVEITDRLPYFESLKRLQEADLLLMPGSTDNAYTASKLYPYILARKPILALFNEESSVVDILKETQAGETVTFAAADSVNDLGVKVLEELGSILKRLPYEPRTDWSSFEPYTAKEMTRKQCDFFSLILDASELAE